MPSTPIIRRGFLTLRDRQVHYRAAGSGPPVVLIHQSPTSARTLDLQTATFAREFTAIAIDIPGLGRSDPLPVPWPEIADQAEALAEMLDALGIERTALYGSHTGALICVEFARRYPRRTAIVLIDGYPIYTPAERARRVATYGSTFAPSWDGSHLLWLWHRYREQNIFWPWNVPSRATRATCDVPDPQFLHDGVVDILGVGNDYWKPYSAAFRYAGEAPFADMKAPVAFLAYADDSLTKALALLPRLPRTCWVERMPGRARGVFHELRLLRRHRAPRDAPALPDTAPLAHGVTRRYVEVEGGQMMVRATPARSGRPLVMIPPAPGSATMIAPLIAALGATRPVVAIDPPGAGDSDPCRPSLRELARRVDGALERLGVLDCDVYGKHGGAAVAVELAARARGRVRRLVVEGAIALPPGEREAVGGRYAVPLAPAWDGTHLITLWHSVRDREFFWPWHARTERATRRIEPRVDPDRLNVEVLSYMRRLDTYAPLFRAVFAYPLERRLARVTQPALFCAEPEDAFAAGTRRAARAARDGRFALLPTDVTGQARAIAAFLDG